MRYKTFNRDDVRIFPRTHSQSPPYSLGASSANSASKMREHEKSRDFNSSPGSGTHFSEEIQVHYGAFL